MSGTTDSEARKVMGMRLQAIREALDLTQEDMAKNMGVVVTLCPIGLSLIPDSPV